MKLYTKQNCPSCEKVKEFIKEKNIQNINIVDLTNDLVRTMNLKDELTARSMRVSFPVLMLQDGKLINPSDAIIAHLQELTSTT